MLFLMLWILSCSSSPDEKDGPIDPEPTTPVKPVDPNPDPNPNPEVPELKPENYPDLMWIYDTTRWEHASYHGVAQFVWSNPEKTPESATLKVQAKEGVCTRTYLSLNLEPYQIYKFSADIRTDRVTGENGAVITIVDHWHIPTKDRVGTSGYETEYMVFQTPKDGKVKLCISLGLNGRQSTGTAYFKNLKVEKADFLIKESKYLRLQIRQDDAKRISQNAFNKWMDNLDKVYESYIDLIGEAPYAGEKIGILGVDQGIKAWGLAGNPIIITGNAIVPTLRAVEEKGDWSFGMMHEIGHDFNSGGDRYSNTTQYWNWEEEMFTNFRMYYAMEMLNASFIQDKLYVGTDAKNYYKSNAGGAYDKLFPKGEYSHDALMYTLIRIKEQIGWEPFKKTFRWLYSNERTLNSKWDKFNFFLDKLDEYSGFDTRSTYLEGELNLIKNKI